MIFNNFDGCQNPLGGLQSGRNRRNILQIDENAFFRGVVERLFMPREFEVSFHETFRFIKKFFPADQLNLHLYDAQMNAIRTIAVATNEGAKKTNTVLPLDKQGIEYFRDPKTPEEELIVKGENNPGFAAIIRYDKQQYEYSVMALHLRKENELFGIVSVLLKGQANTARQLKLLSTLKIPFTFAISTLAQNDEISHLKQRMDGSFIEKIDACLDQSFP